MNDSGKPAMDSPLYKLCFFVPVEHAEAVKEAVFTAGAGRIGNYDKCCWETSGRGQFRPLAGSRAFVGTVGSTERVDEIKVEMVCAGPVLRAAIIALHAAHPYETPAYEYWQINT
jgi:hypothetical protein